MVAGTKSARVPLYGFVFALADALDWLSFALISSDHLAIDGFCRQRFRA